MKYKLFCIKKSLYDFFKAMKKFFFVHVSLDFYTFFFFSIPGLLFFPFHNTVRFYIYHTDLSD